MDKAYPGPRQGGCQPPCCSYMSDMGRSDFSRAGRTYEAKYTTTTSEIPAAVDVTMKSRFAWGRRDWPCVEEKSRIASFSESGALHLMYIKVLIHGLVIQYLDAASTIDDLGWRVSGSTYRSRVELDRLLDCGRSVRRTRASQASQCGPSSCPRARV